MAEVNLKNVKKSFGPVDVIKGVDLTIPDGDFAFSSDRLAAASPRCCA